MTAHFRRFVPSHRKSLCWTLCQRCYTLQTHPKGMPISCDNPFNIKNSEIIDVRTPDEFEKDHIPTAINLPILGHKDHHKVGCLYNGSPFEARILGAQIISQNISNLLSSHFRDKKEDYWPLVYCWRGGQRSRSLAIVLSQIGFKVSVLTGGYKNYRKQVMEQLKYLPAQFQFRVISGLTGSGKSILLQTLQRYGEQVLDLEALANHKGSVLGLLPGNRQPSQKYWESLLRERLASFDSTRPVWVESESRNIGGCWIPEELFKAICFSRKRYVLELPLEERIRHIISEYKFWTVHTEETVNRLNSLRKFHSKKKIDHWCELLHTQQWDEFVQDILVQHYDKTYTRSQEKMFTQCSVEPEILSLSDLTTDTLTTVLKRIV